MGGDAGDTREACAQAVPAVPNMVVAEKKFHDTWGDDLIAVIPAMMQADQWHLPRKVKAEMFGDRLQESNNCVEENLEPAFSSAVLSHSFFLDLYAAFKPKGVLDLTAGNGEAAKAAMLSSTAYVGVVLTETHGIKLEDLLTEWVLKCKPAPVVRREIEWHSWGWDPEPSLPAGVGDDAAPEQKRRRGG